MKPKFSLFFSLALLLIGLFTLSIGGSVALAASRSSLTTAQVKTTGAFFTKAAVASPNITGVNCNGRTDYFRVWTNYPTVIHCFANAGTTSVSLNNASYVCSGNNAGTVYWSGGQHSYPKNWCNWIVDFTHYVYVNKITIK